MKVQPAAFLRTTLPLGIDMLEQYDSGRYHSIWLPDHMVSFWPDSIWTPEFTDLATVSPSPHRHLDGMAVAAAAAVLTNNTPIVTTVVDTVRRHPAMLAQTAVTLDHLSRGRFVLGLGSGELENTVPYGFDFQKPVARFEEALNVITLLWGSDGPVDFDGQFYHLEHARLDTELYDGTCPADLDRRGRTADAAHHRPLRRRLVARRRVHTGGLRGEARGRPRGGRAGRAGSDGHRSGGDPDLPDRRRRRGGGDARGPAGEGDHPAADRRGSRASSATSTRWGRTGEECRTSIRSRCHARRSSTSATRSDTQAIRDIFPCGTPKQVAHKVKGFCDAGMRVFKLMEYGGMGGLKFGARSAAKVRETEDEMLRLVGATAWREP